MVAGMNTSDMPTAEISDPGSTSVTKLPPASIVDSPDSPAARTTRPVTMSGLVPNRAMSRPVTPTISTIISAVIGTSAAPLGNAPYPRTCWR
jgi:hypothetical protein